MSQQGEIITTQKTIPSNIESRELIIIPDNILTGDTVRPRHVVAQQRLLLNNWPIKKNPQSKSSELIIISDNILTGDTVRPRHVVAQQGLFYTKRSIFQFS